MTTNSPQEIGSQMAPTVRDRLLGPRPDIEGFDKKVTAALVVLEFVSMVDNLEPVSFEFHERARKAAEHILTDHSTEITGLYSEISADDLRLIAM